MKKLAHKNLKLFLLAIAFVFATALPCIVMAHTLKIDGPIGVTMHIDPDDDPVARLPAKVFFYFKDETGKLDLNHCNCTVSISNGSSTLYSSAIASSSDMSVDDSSMTVSFPFTFPTEAVYQIVLTGSDFKLTYLQRVDKEGNASSTATLLQTLLGEHVAHIVLFGGAILASLYLIYIDRKEQAALRAKKTK